MPDCLYSILNFVGIPAGGTATLPHNLVCNGKPLKPDLAVPQILDGFTVMSTTTTDLTLRNDTLVPASCLVWCHAIHPIERSFGVPPDDGSLALHMTPQPFVPMATGGGGGGLTAVAHDGTMSGDGTVVDPLSVTPLSGDVTTPPGSMVATIAGHAVTNAKLAQMPTQTLKGNNAGGTADPADLTAAQAKTLLNITAGDISGLAPIATSGSASDLSAGTVPAARMPALAGDVTSPSGSVTTTISANVVTNAKLTPMAATTLKGNSTGAPANPTDLTATQAKTLLNITAGDVSGLAAIATSGSASDLVAGTVPAARMPALTGDVTSSAGSTATTIASHAVTNGQLAQMPATTIKGNNTGGTADAADLTAAQVKTTLGLAAIASSGSASDLVAGTVPAARMPALTGDVTSSAGSTTTAIAANAVTNAQIHQMPTNTVLANLTGGTANPTDATLAALTTALGVRLGQFGDGSDGSGVMDGAAAVTGCSRSGSTYTATREVFFLNLTINAGVTFLPAGFPVWVKGTLTNNGDINSNGNPGSGTSGGAVLWSGAYLAPGAAGGPGGTGVGTAGTSLTGTPREFNGVGGTAGAAGVGGGTGGAGRGGGGGGGGPTLGNGGGAGGAGTQLAAANGDCHDYLAATSGQSHGTTVNPATGGGGGGGAGSGTGSGGGGGGGGGWIVVHAYQLAGSGTYRALGGNGANGVSGNGGGGGGGGGGVFVLVTGAVSPPTPLVTGGTGGTPSGTAASGGNGGDGLAMVFN